MPFIISNIQYNINISNGRLLIKADDLSSKIKYRTTLTNYSSQIGIIFNSIDMIYKSLIDCFKKQQADGFTMYTGCISTGPYIRLGYENAVSNEKEHIYFWLYKYEPNANEQQLQKNMESLNNKIVELENEVANFINIFNELKDHYKNHYVGPYII